MQALMRLFAFAILPVVCIHASDDDPIDYKSLFGDSPRRDLNFPDLVRYDGYEVENHTVITEDGYILALFRLPVKSSCPANSTKEPLIFMHGLFLSGDDCITPGPGNAHCYIYSDACYDVWVPNIRGNRYSRNHTTLDPDRDDEFWDFAFDELSLIDLPAILDYILETTGQPQVSYVAHSQGVTQLLILCAEKPEYNAKIKYGFGLSTTAWLDNARFIIIPIGSLLDTVLRPFNDKTNFEIVAHGGLTQRAGQILCGVSALQYPLCSVFIFAALGYNRFQITPETLRVITGHTPAGTSFKDYLRWGQVRSNGFSKLDYGTLGNIRRYRSLKPPTYDLSPITMQWYFISSENDYVGDVRDIATLRSRLSRSEECILPDTTFAHLDFIYGKDIPNYITPKILTVLRGGQFVCN